MSIKCDLCKQNEVRYEIRYCYSYGPIQGEKTGGVEIYQICEKCYEVQSKIMENVKSGS